MIVVKTSVCLSMCTNTLLYVCSPSKPCPFQHTRIISPVILRRCWCYYWIISQPKRLTMYYKHSKWPTIYTQLFRITSNQLVYTDLMDHRNPHHRQKKKPHLSRICKHHKTCPENYDNSICKHSATVDTFFFAAPLYKQRSPINTEVSLSCGLHAPWWSLYITH